MSTAVECQLRLNSAVVGPWSLNAYALICPATGQSVLADPGAEPNRLIEMLAGTRPVALLITHSHSDHIGALETLRKRLKVPVMAHPGKDKHCSAVLADRWLDDSEMLKVGNHLLRVCHAPGHADDQVCFRIQGSNQVLVGDTLFVGGPGRTWSPQGFKQTLKTLAGLVLGWPDGTICYPGHGPSFCLGDKRAAIEKFIRKRHGNYAGDATWEM